MIFLLQILIVSANTTDNLSPGVGETTKFTFFIQVPENSKLPSCSVVFRSGYSNINNESELTILNVDIEDGNVFRNSQREKFRVEYTSKYLNGQNDTASVDFGNLVNPSTFFRSCLLISDVFYHLFKFWWCHFFHWKVFVDDMSEINLTNGFLKQYSYE